MILLNTTFLVHKSIEKPFISWLNDTYIPTAEKSGIFIEPLLSRVLIESDPEATSYALQMRAQSHDDANNWHEQDATILKNIIFKLWGEKVLHFTTFMEIINR